MKILTAVFCVLSILSTVIVHADVTEDVVNSVGRCQANGYAALNCIPSETHPQSVKALLETLSRCDVLGIEARTCMDLKSSFMRCEANGYSVSKCLPGLKGRANQQLEKYLERCTINGTKVSACL